MVENKEDPNLFTLHVTKNEAGQNVLEVVHLCPVGQDSSTCVDDSTKVADYLRNILASPKGVLVMPKVIYPPKDKEVTAKESSKKKITEKKD